MAKPRRVEVLAARGEAAAEGTRAIGATEAAHCGRRAGCGGLKPGQAERLERPGAGNGRPREAVADLALEKPVPKEAASGSF